jgi:hypothetical protein
LRELVDVVNQLAADKSDEADDTEDEKRSK